MLWADTLSLNIYFSSKRTYIYIICYNIYLYNMFFGLSCIGGNSFWIHGRSGWQSETEKMSVIRMGFNARKTLVFLGSFFDSTDLPLWRPYNLSWWHSWFMLWRPHQYSLFSMPWRCKCEENLKLTNNWFFAHFFFSTQKITKSQKCNCWFSTHDFFGPETIPPLYLWHQRSCFGSFPQFCLPFSPGLKLGPEHKLAVSCYIFGSPLLNDVFGKGAVLPFPIVMILNLEPPSPCFGFQQGISG